ncbi:MAG: tetratricopeptide repeat protein [Acidiferrobacterales bacterium]|nr:tetratricopeptide repeat protein [Acidiferrobacterales bacterium]
MKNKFNALVTACLLLTGIGVYSTSYAQSDEVSEPTEIEDQSLVTQQEVSEPTEPQPAVNFDRQVIANLEAQQQRLIKARAEEDAFSLKLAEVYAEYGFMLSQAGRYDEAKDVYTEALHIQKVNHGIYAPEQLYFLSELFNTAVSMGDSELVESYMTRAISIEEKNEGLLSVDLDGMFLRAGHYYLDQYYQPTRRYKTKLTYLRHARSYFDHILSRQREKTINDGSLPYGELLLVSYLESTILREMPIIIDGDSERFNVSTLSSSPRQAMELDRDYRYVKGAYSRSFRYFNSYIRKAREGGNDQEILNALLSWADTLILFNRNREASNYYKLAWEQSQEMQSSEKFQVMFDKPQPIPAYNYLLERDDFYGNEEIINVPLTFSIDKDGSVSNIQMLNDNEEQKKYLTSARTEARSLHFRPAIINGDLTAVEKFPYEVKVEVN